ncbi:MAG: hypothetical protein KAW66_08035 [Candidatus Lokiarchaeota archaeon]|nr:hypothetical protein [Candidatus Lokiarchaeota archaeon]
MGSKPPARANVCSGVEDVLLYKYMLLSLLARYEAVCSLSNEEFIYDLFHMIGPKHARLLLQIKFNTYGIFKSFS